MTGEGLCAVLATGRPVEVAADAWEAVAATLPRLEAHDTVISGTLALHRAGCGVVAVEQPEPSRRVVRLFASLTEAQAFVAQRLATYERMWDGCGCKIDYHR